MSATAPVMPTGTLYVILGDIVGQVSVAGILLMIVAVIAAHFRRPRGARPRVVADAA